VYGLPDLQMCEEIPRPKECMQLPGGNVRRYPVQSPFVRACLLFWLANVHRWGEIALFVVTKIATAISSELSFLGPGDWQLKLPFPPDTTHEWD